MGYTDAPAGWWQDFVSATPARTAKLAVVRADGSPQVAPVWVDLDGDEIVFMTAADTLKGKAILRDPPGLRLLRRRATTLQLRHHRRNRLLIHRPRRAPVLGDAHRWPLHGR